MILLACVVISVIKTLFLVHTVFDDGLEFIEYHMRNLLVASRINEFILFGKAALSHKQASLSFFFVFQ